jgi:4'-phosphopantetheinyl transferase
MESRTESPGRAPVAWLLQHVSDVATLDDWFSPAECAVLAGLRAARRRRDWRLGRWTAKRALVRAGALGQCVEADLARWSRLSIRATSRGAPCVLLDGVDAPWAVSISHTAEHGLCVVAPAGSAVGCDVETVGRRGVQFVVDWFTEAEKDLVRARCVQEESMVVTLIWSAKESAMKALGVGLRMDTREAAVRLLMEPAADGWSPLRVGTPERRFHGWWRLHGERVITLVSHPAPEVPRALGAFASGLEIGD